jgi:ankyrin repeat protein
MSALRRSLKSCVAAILLVTIAIAPARAAERVDGEELIRVSGQGDLLAVQAQLAAGVDVNARSYSGSTALIEAAAGKHLDVVRALLAAKARPDHASQGWTALFFAVTAGNVEMASTLVQAGADPNITPSNYAGGRSALMTALAACNVRMARLLMEAGAYVNATTSYGATPLWFAVWNEGPEHLAVTRELLQAGAVVDAGHHPRYQLPAGATGSALAEDGSVQVTLPMGRSAEGTVLGQVASSGKVRQLELLLEAGAKVDARQPGWRTPLMLAASAGKPEAVRLLLAADADIAAIDSDGRNALMHARLRGNAETIGLLESPPKRVAR